MSGPLEEVLQQLRVVIGELDRAAVSVSAAQHHATMACAAFDEAATGSAHPQMYIARQEARVAADKAGKVARLLSEAATAFAEYVDRVAPGTVPPRLSAPESMPPGEQLAESSDSGPLSSILLGRIEEVPNADDGLDHMHTLADQIQHAARPGGHAVPRIPAPAAGDSDAQGGSAGDLLLAAMTLAVMGIKGSEVVANLRGKSQLTDDKIQEGDGDG